MDYEQKALALCALGWSQFEIKIRGPRDWYASCAGEIKDGGVLRSTMGNGATPEIAVLDLWTQVTTLEPGQYIVTRAFTDARTAVKWNGFMWEPVVEKNAA